ncbi:glycyl-radical enzyme activating protein [Candidatus Thorarchaeota archaeon]|nr:MAG: glycyl-radical enzyme activating protein [Candidatus Thorarchaeota archaeon]
MKKGIVFDIKKYSLHDGPGIRTTVFLKGCPLTCWWCHNPESRNMLPEAVSEPGQNPDFIQKNEDGGYSLGREMQSGEVLAEIEKDIIFYDESGGGVTFSGGEPLAQPAFLQELLRECGEKDIHRAVDTCGFAEPAVLESVLPLTDLFLYDLKLMDPEEHEKYTGVSNEKILSNLRLLDERKSSLQIRVPVVPGITDTDRNLEATADFLLGLTRVKEINLLSYNHYGDSKYERLGRNNKMTGTESPSRKSMEKIQSFFTIKGFSTTIGG